MPYSMPYSQWTDAEKQAQKENMRLWRERNPEKVAQANARSAAKRRERYATDPIYREKILTNKVWKDAMRMQQKRRRDERKKAVFDNYGWACKCCGETQVCFLTIDHKNNNGAEHRRKLAPKSGSRGAGSGVFYSWLVKNNFPEGFETSCYNCNSGRARCGGVCPHKRARTATLSIASEPV